MNKWIVCTTAHEAFEFDSEAEALAFKDKTEGAFHLYQRNPYKPVKVHAPRLDISVESLEGLRLKREVERQGYKIEYPYTLADVEWVSTSKWYNPFSWGSGYPKLKDSAIAEVEAQ